MQDSVLHALCYEGSVRITAISGKHIVEQARAYHALSRTATAALGRQLLMTGMMASSMKHADERVSTILRGDGPAGTMLCTGAYPCTVKGYVSNPQVELPPTPRGKLDVSGFVGTTGRLTVVRDLSMKEPFVGICDFESGEIAQDFAKYYAVSEQQPSIVYLGVRLDPPSGDVRAAGGVLVQPLPACPNAVLDALQMRAEAISAFSGMLDDAIAPFDALKRIFDGGGLVLADVMDAEYRCDCSRARIEKALISIGKEELTDMIEQDRGAQVSCHFCDKVYDFSREDLMTLMKEASEPND